MKSRTIYGLRCPILKEIRYIGATSQSLARRLQKHMADSRETPKGLWIRKLKQNGLGPEIVEIKVCKESEWEDQERYYIKIFRTRGHLLNVVAGGMGTEGLKHTDAAKEKVRAAFVGKKQSPEHIRKKASAQSKAILQFTLDGELIKEWESGGEIHTKLGLSRGNLSKCCNGKSKTVGGYVWRFKS